MSSKEIAAVIHHIIYWRIAYIMSIIKPKWRCLLFSIIALGVLFRTATQGKLFKSNPVWNSSSNLNSVSKIPVLKKNYKLKGKYTLYTPTSIITLCWLTLVTDLEVTASWWWKSQECVANDKHSDSHLQTWRGLVPPDSKITLKINSTRIQTLSGGKPQDSPR